MNDKYPPFVIFLGKLGTVVAVILYSAIGAAVAMSFKINPLAGILAAWVVILSIYQTTK